MAAHFVFSAQYACRSTDCHHIRFYVVCYDGATRDDGAGSDAHAGQEQSARSYDNALLEIRTFAAFLARWMQAVCRARHGVEVNIILARRVRRDENVVVEPAVVANFDAAIGLREGSEAAVFAEVTLLADDGSIACLEASAESAARVDNSSGADYARLADFYFGILVVVWVTQISDLPLADYALRADEGVGGNVCVLVDDCSGFDLNAIAYGGALVDNHVVSDRHVAANFRRWIDDCGCGDVVVGCHDVFTGADVSPNSIGRRFRM